MKPIKRTRLDLPACHEVQIHYKRPLYNAAKKISSYESAEKTLRDFIDLNRIDHKEFFWIILMTNANQVLAVSELGSGCTSGVSVSIKEICQLALLSNAKGIIIAHNHPSGKLEASEADRNITQKLIFVLDILNITLLDHLIITSEDCISFAENNWMESS